MLPQSMSRHLDKLSQRPVHFFCIAGILREGMLVADRLWLFVKIEMGGIQALGFPMERFSPLAEQFVQRLPTKPGEFCHRRDAKIMESLLGDLADPGKFADPQRCQ